MEQAPWQVVDGGDAESGSSRLSARGDDEDGLPTDDLPACQSCRRRKSKCSRERPSCSQCIRLRAECVYVTKQKPGLKAGAIDNLSTRLRLLEELFLDGSGNRKRQLAFLDEDADETGRVRLQSLGSTAESRHGNDVNDSPAEQRSFPRGASSSSDGHPHKRRRVEDVGHWWDDAAVPWMPPLPGLPVLEAIVEAHFRTLHHWIPILHETRFRATLKDERERARLVVLFHALVSTSVKYIALDEFGITPDDAERIIRVSRRAVMMNAMESMSIENTQALVLLAFDYMFCGDVAKAWPIIGSLTRTVSYLQLTVEPDDESRKQQLLRPLSLIDKPEDWTDSESRRRLFWVIFLLDRTCSITSGWHTSLTSDDMHRRLPCSGGLWAREEPVSTPFFGIWDKSAARIGNSIASVSSMYHQSPRSAELPNTPPSNNVDTSKLGAFSHCIEATENLSQVTAFFLQQDVDFEDRREVKDWLTRFKELDLRLVHWKMFLPQQWQDSNVSRDASVVKMDPNLTLAHVTHNTSMILLHQHIAYPPPSWADVVRLPSSCSVETCQLAAVETASIVEKYLHFTRGGIVNTQFAFCAFVAARVLLVQWRSSEGSTLSPAFSSLVESLRDMSDRWLGCFAPFRDAGDEPGDAGAHPGMVVDVAARYASQLADLQSRCANDASFAPSGLAEILLHCSFEGLVERCTRPATVRPQNGNYASRYIDPLSQRSPALTRDHHSQSPSTLSDLSRQYPHIHNDTKNNTSIQRPPRHTRPAMEFSGPASNQTPHGSAMVHSQYDTSVSPAQSGRLLNAANRLPVAVNVPHAFGNMQPPRPRGLSEEDELAAMSQMLLEHQFLQMDRVIRLDGSEFFNNGGDGLAIMS